MGSKATSLNSPDEPGGPPLICSLPLRLVPLPCALGRRQLPVGRRAIITDRLRVRATVAFHRTPRGELFTLIFGLLYSSRLDIGKF